MDRTLLRLIFGEILAAGHVSASARVALLSAPHAEDDPANAAEDILRELGIENIERISVAEFDTKDALERSAGEIIGEARTGAFDFVIDNHASVHAFNMARCIEGLFLMTCAPGLILAHHQPHFGGGYLAVQSEYFEDVAAFNELDVLYSGTMIDGRLSANGTGFATDAHKATPDRNRYFYVLRKTDERAFTLPYQGQVAGRALGIFGFEKHYLASGEGYRYKAVHAESMAQQVSRGHAFKLLMRQVLARAGLKRG